MRNRRELTCIGVLLALLTVAAFLPVRHNGFIFFDDPDYVTSNPHVAAGLTGAGLSWALTATAAGNWHPLTWVSHMLDVTLFGMDPAAHHLSGLALHALTTVLLFLLLAAMTGRSRRAAWVAALFALHPLHVESVAWASERKDLLSGLFWMLTTGAYVWYARRPGAGRYAATLLCFALGLTAKPMLVTLPVVLLLLDWWPLGRTASAPDRGANPGFHAAARLVVEKLPLLALSCASSAVTLLVQRKAGFVKGLDLIPLVPRLFNAAVAYVSYLGKTVWPFGLSPFYPHLGPETHLGTIFFSLGVLLAITYAARLTWRSRPWLLVGWLWYLGTLLPVVGVVQVGWQAMADRYTYLPLIGVFLAIVWEAGRRTGNRRARRALVAGGLLLLAGCGALTWRQAQFWRDSVSVFSRAVALAPENMMAEYYLGIAYRHAGNPGEAIRHLREAIRINPRFPGIHIVLGLTLSESGDLDGAIRAYERALQLEPESASTHNNLGNCFFRLGLPERALKHYEAALRIKPRYALARTNAAAALAQLGRDAEAERYLEQAQQERRESP